MVFDSLLCFIEHVKTTTDKLQKRNNVIKKLSGNDWGCSTGTLTVTYKAIGRSVLNYGAPIWSPSISNTNWSNFHIQQNIALRTNFDDLHRETKVLSVKTHTDMLAEQFSVGCHQIHRSGYQTIQHPVERLNKPILPAAYGVEIQHLDEGLIFVKTIEKL